MKKQRRKTKSCLNCQRELDPSFNYCPACGQENNDQQISFGKLLRDFFSNYFSLDSRFGRSFEPFFLRPGQLTREFMNGKRVKYANPIRLYLVVSLVHFFILNLSIDDTPNTNRRIFESSSDQTESDSASIAADSMNTLDLDLPVKINQADTVPENNWPMSGADWKTIRKLTDPNGINYSVQQIEDSIKNEDNPYVAAKINRQIIKLLKTDQQTIGMLIVKNIPIMMFLLLPIYALLLKLFFRKRLYINHLIHGLHIHSFVFIVLSLYWILESTWAEHLDIVFFLLNTVYVILSFRNTYGIKYRTAIFKTVATGFIYMFILSTALMLETAISLLLF